MFCEDEQLILYVFLENVCWCSNKVNRPTKDIKVVSDVFAGERL